jgi:hypothetical protein
MRPKLARINKLPRIEMSAEKEVENNSNEKINAFIKQ